MRTRLEKSLNLAEEILMIQNISKVINLAAALIR